MNLTHPRIVYQPYEYPEAYDFWLLQEQAHWLHTEIPMNNDIVDYNEKLGTDEKNLIINLLKSFTQIELSVGNDYWTTCVHKWFPKPEIQMMALAFANMETIHQKSYAYLNESLGLEDWEAFLKDEAGKAKLDYLEDDHADQHTTLRDKALSLAKYSGCAEGVLLFSSFAVVMNFQRFDLLKGTTKIVELSVKDESLHANGGCWLFRQLVNENRNIFDEDLKEEVRQAFRDTVALEDNYIDSIFGTCQVILELDKDDLKVFIRNRANTKLVDLMLDPIFTNLNPKALSRMNWFDDLILGTSHQDFYAGREANYSKGAVDWSSDVVF